MNNKPNSKIVGAFLVGFAMVAGAYTVSNFGKSYTGVTPAIAPIVSEQQAAPIRSAIEVTDEDGNGIEDWRDEFVTTEPIILNREETEEYTPPDTVTGQMGIDFIQDIVRARGYGEFGMSDEEVINDTISNLQYQTSHSIYDTPDVIINTTWTAEDIKTYANEMAQAILNNSTTELDHELFILRDIMNRSDKSRFDELQTIAEMYRLTKEEMLTISVPQSLVKEHLDIINTMHAVHNDIIGMTLSYDDPAYTLLRLKRYEDDVIGMRISLENLYFSLEPYASLFVAEDPALYFVQFAPVNNLRI